MREKMGKKLANVQQNNTKFTRKKNCIFFFFLETNGQFTKKITNS